MHCQYKNGKKALSFWTDNASSSQKYERNANDCWKLRLLSILSANKNKKLLHAMNKEVQTS